MNRTALRNKLLYLALLVLPWHVAQAQRIVTQATDPDGRIAFAKEYLARKINDTGIEGMKTKVVLRLAKDTLGLKHEGFRIFTKGHTLTIEGKDPSGIIYGCSELADWAALHHNLNIPSTTQNPGMVLRGTCVGLQKTTYLPGHQVYEYPYTPENFPWFYDKALWTRYLDMLVDNKMNTLYLWNGHPFASLVRLKDYPFAVEVDSATFRKNQEMYDFLTREAGRRGIEVIQMFYNIIVSKPFADHYGIKTQDRHRPITPLLSDYTRKSIAAFIERYPHVGLLVCLGEAMDTYEDDVEWMTKTIIPGVKDGLRALGRTDEPPILLRAHDTDCKAVMKAALPLYHNLYTMHKYNGESLTTYQPRGPWSEMHRELAALGSTHISNVHILANLEPWRWGAPDFVRRCVIAMHDVHQANGLHLYPQASYWDWPYTADEIHGAHGATRELQLDRDWPWYKEWGRYAWNCRRDSTEERTYWAVTFGRYYDCGEAVGDSICKAYDESGEIAPKLLRNFGITEGNRQTLLLGMKISQLVNPKKYTMYYGFRESCGPGNEQPLDIIRQCERHGDLAVHAIDAVADKIGAHDDEFRRLQNDMHCYRLFAYSFAAKVRAAEHVLTYNKNKDINELKAAVPLLEESQRYYRRLIALTDTTYLYANSMQTAQRRIPIGGDNGKFKHWRELYPVYQQQLDNLKKNIAVLEKGPVEKAKAKKASIKRSSQAIITQPSTPITHNSAPTTRLTVGARLFSDLDSTVVALAPEIEGMQAMVVNSGAQRKEAQQVVFDCRDSVSLLVGYFRDDQIKYAQAPKLETDASANDYGQAEPLLVSALQIKGMPQVNVHAYHFGPGHHELLLPKGIVLVLGATTDKIKPRDAGLTGQAADWMFY